MCRQFMVVVTTARYAQIKLLVTTDIKTKDVITAVREYLEDNEQFNGGDCTYEIYSVLNTKYEFWSIGELSRQTGMYSLPMADYDYSSTKRHLEYMVTDAELAAVESKGE